MSGPGMDILKTFCLGTSQKYKYIGKFNHPIERISQDSQNSKIHTYLEILQVSFTHVDTLKVVKVCEVCYMLTQMGYGGMGGRSIVRGGRLGWSHDRVRGLD